MSDAAYIEDEVEFVDELKPGTKLMRGQYTIDSFLAAGGFGITYLAKDSLDRYVVIKECFPGSFCRRQKHSVMPRSRAHQNELKSIVRLFSQEAMSLSKAGHPNVVGVHQVFEENNTAYMALDYVEGNDLLEILTESPESLEPEQIQAYLKAMLGAISHVHSQGILHRDISPDNIIISKDNQPVLIDFGAAREDASKASRMLSALRVVKDGYSPQEFYIAGSDQGPSCDLYSLAASFYHLITGQLPPDSQSRLTAFAAHEDDPYVPLASLGLPYPVTFSKALDKAMSVLPKDRMQSAEQWLDHMAGNAEVEEDKVAAQPLAAGTTKSTKPIVIGGIALAALAGAGIAFLPKPNQDQEASVPAPVQEEATFEVVAQTETSGLANVEEQSVPAVPSEFTESLSLPRDSVQLTVATPDVVPELDTSAPIALATEEEIEAPAPAVEPAPTVSEETAPVEVVTAPQNVETFETSSVVERKQRTIPFTLSSENPGLVASVASGAPFWLTEGVQIASINGKPMASNEAILEEINGSEGDVVSIGIDARLDQAVIERPLVIGSETQTFLLNGLAFATTEENRQFVTRVTAAPDGSNFRVGDIIVAYVNTAERLGGDVTIKSIVERELERGATSFSFAVEREGEVWVEAFNLAALTE